MTIPAWTEPMIEHFHLLAEAVERTGQRRVQLLELPGAWINWAELVRTDFCVQLRAHAEGRDFSPTTLYAERNGSTVYLREGFYQDVRYVTRELTYDSRTGAVLEAHETIASTNRWANRAAS